MIEEVLKAGKESGAFVDSLETDWENIFRKIWNVFFRIDGCRSEIPALMSDLGRYLSDYTGAFRLDLPPTI